MCLMFTLLNVNVMNVGQNGRMLEYGLKLKDHILIFKLVLLI